eukprot:7384569-Prymnesium_polylepis.1
MRAEVRGKPRSVFFERRKVAVVPSKGGNDLGCAQQRATLDTAALVVHHQRGTGHSISAQQGRGGGNGTPRRAAAAAVSHLARYLQKGKHAREAEESKGYGRLGGGSASPHVEHQYQVADIERTEFYFKRKWAEEKFRMNEYAKLEREIADNLSGEWNAALDKRSHARGG